MTTRFKFSPSNSTTIINQCEPKYECEPVLRMIIGGTPIDEWESPDTKFHFRIFLLVSDERCVCLNMLPEWENQQIGKLTVTSYGDLVEFTQPQTVIRFEAQLNGVTSEPGDVDVSTQAVTTTVAELVNLWISLGRDRYHFDSNGEGCRTWCRALLQDAESNGFVRLGSCEEFRQFEQRMRAEKGPMRIPIPCAAGTFY
ncbi:hypothetical protein H0H92_014000 [Tricholoma furcatifolium]|nr:hypothetical protein H0H92_014000 [Tricholoma furcatifolium]